MNPPNYPVGLAAAALGILFIGIAGWKANLTTGQRRAASGLGGIFAFFAVVAVMGWL